METFTVFSINMLNIAKDLKSLTKCFKTAITKVLTSKTTVIMEFFSKKITVAAARAVVSVEYERVVIG
jgi:hypothetical protein